MQPAIYSLPEYEVQYQTEDYIGEGGMGKVYLVRDMSTGHFFAEKRVRLQGVDPAHNEDREPEYMLRVRGGPNIAQVHNSEVIGRYLYIRMHFYPGGDLNRVINKVAGKGGIFQEFQVVDVTLAIALALEYCHSQKLLHKDLKPQNVLVQTQWDPLSDANTPQIYVSDFGLAAVVESLSSRSAEECGTPGWKAPEVENQGAHAKFGQKSDVYPLGLIMYKMCTFSLPNNKADILSDHIPSTYSIELRDLIRKMLRMSRDQRPTATDVVGILRSISYKLRSCSSMQQNLPRSEAQSHKALLDEHSVHVISRSRKQKHIKKPMQPSYTDTGSPYAG